MNRPTRIVAGAIAGVGVLALSTVVLAAPSSAAARFASGGGCATGKASGYSIGSCISAFGNIAEPDIYVNSVGSDCKTILWTLYVGGKRLDRSTVGCESKHVVLPNANGPGKFFLRVQPERANGSFVFTEDSPVVNI